MRISKLAAAAIVTIAIVTVGFGLKSFAQEVLRGYGSSRALERGTIVSLEDNQADAVTPASANQLEAMFGVVVRHDDAPITVSSEEHQTFVSTTGQYEVLVSSEGGSIVAGDYITVGSIDGIGVKASQSQPVVFGQAAGSFDGSAENTIGSESLSTETGDRDVAIGRIPVTINITANPIAVEEINIPDFLKRTAESVADQPVSAPRLYASIVVLIATIAIVVSMLYAGIRSGIVSIGRNPLSKKTITKGLLQVIAGSMFIFVAGLFAVYLLLKV